MEIDDTLFEKIYDFSIIREEVEPLFTTPAVTETISVTNKEKNLIDMIRDKKLKPEEVRKLIKDGHGKASSE
jgi:hypothetical protein